MTIIDWGMKKTIDNLTFVATLIVIVAALIMLFLSFDGSLIKTDNARLGAIVIAFGLFIIGITNMASRKEKQMGDIKWQKQVWNIYGKGKGV